MELVIMDSMPTTHARIYVQLYNYTIIIAIKFCAKPRLHFLRFAKFYILTCVNLQGMPKGLARALL